MSSTQPLVTENAVVGCLHVPMGRVQLDLQQQRFVSVTGNLVLVKGDPLWRTIVGCQFRTPVGQQPCVTTILIDHGYSEFIRINQRPVVLASLQGRTNGAVPGVPRFTVRDPGQSFVGEAE